MSGIFSPDAGYKPSGLNREVLRYAAVYDPASTTEVNYSLLPPLDEMRSMNLSHPQDIAPEPQLIAWLRPRLLRILIILPLLIWVCLAVSPLLGDLCEKGFHYAEESPKIMFYVLGGGGFLVLIGAGLTLYTSKGKALVFYGLIVPVIAMVLLVVLRPVLADRAKAVMFALPIALFFLLSPGRGLAPFSFYWRWLHCNPAYVNYRGTFREMAFRVACFIEIGLGVGFVLGSTLAFEGSGPVAWKLEQAVALSVLGLVIFIGLGLWKRAERVLAHFLTYGDGLPPAPGTWSYPTPVETRRRRVILTLAAFAVLLSLNFCLYMTPKVVRGHAMTSEAKNSSFVQDDKQTFGALRHMYGRLSSERSSEVLPDWGISAVLVVLVPTGLLALIFSLPLIHLWLTERWLKRNGKKFETRWEAYAAVVRTSPHIATEPLGTVVREAEHIFLGAEPVLSFPILLDVRLIAEHVYVAGDSGSGKTSMCLMPMLIQLIRGSEGWEEESK